MASILTSRSVTLLASHLRHGIEPRSGCHYHTLGQVLTKCLTQFDYKFGMWGASAWITAQARAGVAS